MEANAITSPSQVNLGFAPAIWADLNDALISGTAVSQWDRLTKHVPAGQIALAPTLPDGTAVLPMQVGGIAPI